MQTPIVIEDSDPNWSVTFERIRLELAAALGTLALRIEHVGSTAVPGLPAKPIIDIDVVMDTEFDLPAVTACLARIGYTYQGDLGIPRRYAFRARDPEPAHHLYVCAQDSPELHRHISFRDYLRAHPSTAQAYGLLKRQILAEVAGDRLAYTERKGAFIEAILQMPTSPFRSAKSAGGPSSIRHGSAVRCEPWRPPNSWSDAAMPPTSRPSVVCLCVLGLLTSQFPYLALAASTANTTTDPDTKARTIEAQMTDEERFTLLHGIMAMPLKDPVPASELGGIYAAGYVAGVPRLGIPALHETDASLGVTNPRGARGNDFATALPAGLALASSFNPDLARSAGATVGNEARAKGFNVLLGGGMDLIRDPRNGRNFEYLSEDPLLSGILGAEEVIGAQSQGVVSTVKHYALNANESHRHVLDALIDPAALRESDLLAFQIAIERGKPGSVMCSYNKVNGVYACGNGYLQNEVLKETWHWPGWVMSDWGAVYASGYEKQGLDQQSGSQLDPRVWFDAPLKADLAAGTFTHARLSDMVRRILRSLYAVGADKPTSPGGPIDFAAHNEVALEGEREGIVLLKNDGVLPLASTVHSILVIGGHANVGVLSGGGSSLVTPPGGFKATNPWGGEGEMADWRAEHYSGTAPIAELRKILPNAAIRYEPGLYPASAAAAAHRADVAIVFVTKYEQEGYDSPDLTLPAGQDAVVTAVAAANPNTIVVLETGNPIAMPWRDHTKGIIAAWYPGQAGAQAIAEVLTGKINPSGHLPVTFPVSTADLPRPDAPGLGTPENEPITVDYSEGADVGYRWFAKQGRAPLYPFGYGLSYTHFGYSDLHLHGKSDITATFTVRNEGDRAGADIPQLYLTSMAGTKTLRLLGFQRVSLSPGESRQVDLHIDSRLLASFDTHAKQWRISPGRYEISLAKYAGAEGQSATVTLPKRLFGH
jgi:beta-glucosidase